VQTLRRGRAVKENTGLRCGGGCGGCDCGGGCGGGGCGQTAAYSEQRKKGDKGSFHFDGRGFSFRKVFSFRKGLFVSKVFFF
jgi:hypothetical protein